MQQKHAEQEVQTADFIDESSQLLETYANAVSVQHFNIVPHTCPLIRLVSRCGEEKQVSVGGSGIIFKHGPLLRLRTYRLTNARKDSQERVIIIIITILERIACLGA